MLPLTIFLAKLLGLYCIIVALAMMTCKHSTVATIRRSEALGLLALSQDATIKLVPLHSGFD